MLGDGTKDTTQPAQGTVLKESKVGVSSPLRQQADNKHQQQHNNIENNISPIADFDTRQTMANICLPLLLWIGFIGLNITTTSDDASYTGGRRLIMTVVSSFSAFLLIYLYVNFNCIDMEIIMKHDDIRARTFLSLKCFLSGLIEIGEICFTCELEGVYLSHIYKRRCI